MRDKRNKPKIKLTEKERLMFYFKMGPGKSKKVFVA